MTEAEFQAQVIGLAEMRGWQVMHVRRAVAGRKGKWLTPTSLAGWPDLVLFKPGRGILYRELKTDRGRVSADQVAVLGALTAAGGDAGVWRPRDWPVIADTLTRRAG